MSKNILAVKNLKTYFYTDNKVIPAVDDVSFDIARGETLSIVGESGSGKSVTALSMMRLVPNPPGKTIGGQFLFKGEDLLKKTEKEMRGIRGNNISMIFQEPMTSLNPVYTIGRQVTEAILLHQNLSQKAAWEKALEMLSLVKIPLPEQRMKQYPHQLSGGMNQRVMIAMALSCQPELLIADEPTTALDVTIQAQILETLKELKSRTGAAVLLITHDLGVVAEMATSVLVMYCGRVVEQASASRLFKEPLHPYTIGLLKSLPKLKGPKEKLYSIRGMVPTPSLSLKGCRFLDRCEDVKEICARQEPDLLEHQGSMVRCWKYQ